METIIGSVLGLLWAVAAAGVAWSCAGAAGRITYVTLADGQRAERRLPAIVRLLLPLAPNLTPFFERSWFDAGRKRIGRKLVAAGLDEVLGPSEFMAVRVLAGAVVGVLLAAAFHWSLMLLPGRLGAYVAGRRLFFYALALALAWFYLPSWLNRELKARHGKIQRKLPFVLDLLTLSVEAGMDFMSGLQRIVDKQGMDPLCEELIRVLREIQLGKTRRHALRDMANRVDQTDLRSVVGSLVQADEMGVSIGTILRIQADQMRMRRFQRAEKLAHEAPVKMLFPLIAFIFPAVFFILLGPVFMEMAKTWH